MRELICTSTSNLRVLLYTNKVDTMESATVYLKLRRTGGHGIEGMKNRRQLEKISNYKF